MVTLDRSILLLGSADVQAALTGEEEAIMRHVENAYLHFGRGDAMLPSSTFLRFRPGTPDRIIALPAYLGGNFESAGIKWISSVPSNHKTRLDRASAVIVLNDVASGRATAVMEGSLISAKRTAAGAALAAKHLLDVDAVDEVGIIGLGVINLEVLRFLKAVFPRLQRSFLFDINPDRVTPFSRLVPQVGGLEPVACRSIGEVLGRCKLSSLATDVSRPHINDPDCCRKDAVILGISLRDFGPNVILRANNVVDSPEHICQAETSVHLAEKVVKNRNFLNSITDVLQGRRQDWDANRPTIVSPFGLGILDIAVATLAVERAQQLGRGTHIGDFHPAYWVDRESH